MPNPTWEDSTEIAEAAPTWEDSTEIAAEAAPTKKKRGALEGAFAQNAADSASLGFKDEIQGGLGALLDLISAKSPDAPGGINNFSNNYEGLRDSYREDIKEVSAESPKAAMAGQIAGMIVPGAVGGKVLSKAPKVIGNMGGKKILGANPLTMGEVAAVGAGVGGMEGLGSSEGEGLDLLSDTAQGAAMGLVGGVAGKKGADLLDNMAVKSHTKATRQMGDDTASKAFEQGSEDVLDQRIKEALGHRMSRDIAKETGDKVDVKAHKAALKFLRARGAPPGSISEVKTILRDVKDYKPEDIKRWSQKLGIDLSPEALGQILRDTTVMSSLSSTGRKTMEGVGGLLKDLASFQPKKIKQHAGKLGFGAVATAVSPLGLASPLLTAAFKNLDARDFRNIKNIVKRNIAVGTMKATRYGSAPTVVGAAYGSNATTQSSEERTKAFVDQQSSKSARERMRNR